MLNKKGKNIIIETNFAGVLCLFYLFISVSFSLLFLHVVFLVSFSFTPFDDFMFSVIKLCNLMAAKLMFHVYVISCKPAVSSLPFFHPNFDLCEVIYYVCCYEMMIQRNQGRKMTENNFLNLLNYYYKFILFKLYLYIHI